MKIHNAKFGLLVQHKESGELFRIGSFDKNCQTSGSQEVFVFPVSEDCGQRGSGCWKKAEDYRIYKGEKINWGDVEVGQELQLNRKGLTFSGYGDFEEEFNTIVENNGVCFLQQSFDGGDVLVSSKEDGQRLWITTHSFKQPRSPIPMLGV